MFVSELPFNMPPKRRHDSESSSGAAAVKRIRIVAKNEQFICTDCGASLESVKQLNSHMRRHKTFLCDKCNKSISLNNKQRHQKLCGNGNQEVKMHSCAECDYKTKDKSNFNKHKKTHSKLLCDECGHVATSLQHLDEHKAMSHIPKMYKCEYCDFKSKRKWHTKRHQELNCSVHKNRLLPALTNEEALQLFSDCNITKFDFNKILRHIRKKWGRHAVAKNYSVSLDIFAVVNALLVTTPVTSLIIN